MLNTQNPTLTVLEITGPKTKKKKKKPVKSKKPGSMGRVTQKSYEWRKNI